MKIRTLVWAAAAIAATAPFLPAMPRQEGGLPEAVLKELKAATVYVRVAEGGVAWSGSGFLFRKEGTFGYIATNAHVAEGNPAQRQINAIFYSGSPREVQLPATVMALDYERDLAVIRVSANDLPKPIDTRSKKKLKETLVLYTVGFPLGGRIAAGAKNPEATFGKSSVSSLRSDSDGELQYVQLDGELNPGNSGGPAVDEAGDLVGVVFAGIRRTQIGFAVPAAHLEDLIQGRAEGMSGEITKVDDKGAKLRVRTDVLDPFKKLKSVSVLWAPLDPDAKPRRPGEPMQANMREQALKIDGNSAWADVSIPSESREEMVVVFQLRVVRGDGEARLGSQAYAYLNFQMKLMPLEEILMWQDTRPLLSVIDGKETSAKCGLELGLLIPAKVRSVTMLVKRPAMKPRIPKPGNNGLWARMSGDLQEVSLTPSGYAATGEFEVKGDPGGGAVTLVLQGQIELEDRRKVYTSPVIQQVPFARAGRAKPPPKDDWISAAAGKDLGAPKGAGGANPTPEAEERPLADAPRKVLDATVTKLKLAAKDHLPIAAWSSDARHVYLLESAGTLRMVSVPELKEVRRLKIGSGCGSLARSKEGLVVHVKDRGEVWLLDEGTLEVRHRVAAVGIVNVAAAPGSSFAYLSASKVLIVVDLKAGRVVKQHQAEEISKKYFEKIKKVATAAPLWDWGWIALSANGEDLISVDRRLCRFRVSGSDVVWEEAGIPRRELKDVALSPDGKYLAVLENPGESFNSKTQPVIYAVKDVQKPLVALATGLQMQKPVIAFDREAGKIYCGEYGTTMVVFTPKGERAKQYELATGATANFLEAHPGGNKVLVGTNDDIYWVELGK